jgi:ribonuclease P protein component
MPSIARKITKFTQKEIDYLFAHARRILKNTSCLILSCPRQLDFARVLIIISKNVGNAPERNLLRRRIKSIFYEEKLFETPCDYAIILYKPVKELSFDDLKAMITHVIHQ